MQRSPVESEKTHDVKLAGADRTNWYGTVDLETAETESMPASVSLLSHVMPCTFSTVRGQPWLPPNAAISVLAAPARPRIVSAGGQLVSGSEEFAVA